MAFTQSQVSKAVAHFANILEKESLKSESPIKFSAHHIQELENVVLTILRKTESKSLKSFEISLKNPEIRTIVYQFFPHIKFTGSALIKVLLKSKRFFAKSLHDIAKKHPTSSSLLRQFEEEIEIAREKEAYDTYEENQKNSESDRKMESEHLNTQQNAHKKQKLPDLSSELRNQPWDKRNDIEQTLVYMLGSDNFPNLPLIQSSSGIISSAKKEDERVDDSREKKSDSEHEHIKNSYPISNPIPLHFDNIEKYIKNMKFFLAEPRYLSPSIRRQVKKALIKAEKNKVLNSFHKILAKEQLLPIADERALSAIVEMKQIFLKNIENRSSEKNTSKRKDASIEDITYGINSLTFCYQRSKERGRKKHDYLTQKKTSHFQVQSSPNTIPDQPPLGKAYRPRTKMA